MVEINEGIRVSKAERCFLCGGEGDVLYRDMRDRLFDAPGKWSIRRCKDSSCGLLYLDPVPLEEDTGILYPGSYYTHAQPELSRWMRLSRAIKRNSTIGRFFWSSMYHQGAKKGRLLDVGAGSGLYLSHMRELGWEVEGVDFDCAAAKCASESFGLKVSVGTLEEVKYRADIFDAVTANHVIEHVHDPVKFLEEIKRILRPGGSLVVTCPNSRSLGHRIFKGDYVHLDPPRHLYSFSRKNVRAIAEKAGLKVNSVRSIISGPRQIYLQGIEIKRTGKSPPNYRPPSRYLRVKSLFFALYECLMLAVDKDAGEELVLVAVKER
ncbi:MAG: class I SAM-dependent methyltransferase [Thermodesulfobacteriota bacterium]